MCGNLNVIGPHNFIGSDTIRGYSFVRVGTPCWRNCITMGLSFKASYAQGIPESLNQLPVTYKM